MVSLVDCDSDVSSFDEHDKEGKGGSPRADVHACCHTLSGLAILLCLVSLMLYALISGRASHFASKAASDNHPGSAAENERAQRYADLLPISALTYDFPVIVVVRNLRPGSSTNSFADPWGSFANFSRALEARISPTTSCLSRSKSESSERMLPVQRLEGYHLTSLPPEERRNLLSQDGESAVIRVVNCRTSGNFVSKILRNSEFVRDRAIPEALRDVASGFEDQIQVGILEMTQVLMEAKDVVIYELSHTDAITLPIAMSILIATAGPLSLLVLIVLPMSLLPAFTILDFCMDYIRFSFLVPPVFVTLGVALSLDYALLLLCRFNEDVGLRCKDAIDAGAAREASRAAVYGMMRHAGFAVFSSSILLAFAFATLFVTANSEEIASIGFGGAVTVMCCVCVSLVFFPTILLLLADLAPRQLVGMQLCGCCPQERRHSLSRLNSIVGSKETSSFYDALAMIGIRRPRLVLLAALFLGLPLCWRGALLQPSIDQRALVPLSSSFSVNEQVLVNSDMPPSHIMPPMLVLGATRRLTNATAVCEDRDEVLRSFLDYVLPSGTPVPDLLSCAVLGDLVCSPHALQQLLPHVDPDLVLRQAELLRSKLCPLTCDVCGSSDMPLLSDEAFNTLHAIQEVYEDSIDIVEARARGHLVHIGKLGSDIVSAADARRYISGGEMFNEIDAARADAFRANFARLTNIDGSGTVVQLFHPFRCMSDEGADWGRVFLRKLKERGLHGVGISDSPNAVNLTFIMHEQGVWEEADSTYSSFLAASLASVSCLLLLTGLIFRSIVLPPRLLFTVILAIGVACGVCGFVIDDFSLPGVYWVLPPIAIPVITGLTLDYDLYILTRILEYRMQGLPTTEAFEIGLGKSRGAISMAGIVMATAFSALCFSELLALRQLGVLLVTATLCDTFLIRPLVVPACAFAFWSPEANWWPRRMPPIQETRMI